MRNLLQQLKNDENGMIISAELVLVVTIGVLGMIVGLNSVASSINGELNDVASAFGAIDQSYAYRGMTKFGHASVAGSGYIDAQDYCDCTAIVPTMGVVKHQGTYSAPRSYVPLPAPQPVVPCDNCPVGPAPHNLKPTPDHGPHHHHPHPKHPPRKHQPHPKGPKFNK